MSSTKFFFYFIPILSFILLIVNFILAPHMPYKEKKTPFECGYHSFLAQNRTQFTISFFIFALLFLLFDIEIVSVYPLTVSSYFNSIYGFCVVVVFVLILTLGFVFELGKNALNIETKQSKNSYAHMEKAVKLGSFMSPLFTLCRELHRQLIAALYAFSLNNFLHVIHITYYISHRNNGNNGNNDKTKNPL